MLDMYGAAAEATEKIVAGIASKQMTLPTPCASYTVKGVVNHLVAGFDQWVAMASGKIGEFVLDKPDVADAVKAYRAGRKAALKAFAGADDKTFVLPGGLTMPGSQALGIALMEVVVHGWDIAKATGQDTSIDEMLAAGMLGGLEQMGLPRSPDGNPFGDAVRVSAKAPAGDRLVAFLGRKP